MCSCLRVDRHLLSVFPGTKLRANWHVYRPWLLSALFQRPQHPAQVSLSSEPFRPFLCEPGQAQAGLPQSSGPRAAGKAEGLSHRLRGRTGPAAGKKGRSPEEAGLGEGRGPPAPPPTPPPTRVGGQHRRLCSLLALCPHMVHPITVTAWNGDGPWRARALGLGLSGALDLQHRHPTPHQPHFSPPPSPCPSRVWSSGWTRLRGTFTPALRC